MKIKICGLQSLEDISYINEFMVDFAGFIFYPKSKRFITIKQSELMKNKLNSNIKTVGVFVDEDLKNLEQIIKTGVLDFVQLHGNENNQYINYVKETLKIPVIKAFKADCNLKFNIDNTNADFVLIDSFNKNSFGGTGNSFDWKIIPKTNKKIFLAGGLNSENVLSAMHFVNPYCLDINSGVEINGRKDRKKISDIIKIIKGYKND